MRHTSVNAERKRKPARSLNEALDRLRATSRQVQVDTRYPAKGNEHTARIGRRMQGEGNQEDDG